MLRHRLPSGRFCRRAFAEKGYPVMELEGGFEGWKEHHLDVERDAVNRLKKTASRLLHRH